MDARIVTAWNFTTGAKANARGSGNSGDTVVSYLLMRTRALQTFFSVAATLLTITLSTASQAAPASAKVVAYVPNWIDLRAFAKTIDYTKVTHLNIAFENPTGESGDLSFDSANEVLLNKAHENHVQVLLSIGGGLASTDKTLLARYADLLSDAKRAAFVAKLADYVVKHGFDGVDVDLEGPSIGKNYGAFIEDLSRALKPLGKTLTAALSQGYGGPDVPDAALQHFDFVNIMAYDATGYWNSKLSGQHSSLEFAKSSVDYWLKRGLPKSKAVLGVPFYGYGFGEAFRERGYSYSEIVAAFPGAENTNQAGNTIWYNGAPTIAAKAHFVKEQGLAGVMIWSLDQDVPGSRSLLLAIHEGLR